MKSFGKFSLNHPLLCFQYTLPWAECPTEVSDLGNSTTMIPVKECEMSSETQYFWYREALVNTLSLYSDLYINLQRGLGIRIVWIPSPPPPHGNLLFYKFY